MRARHLQGPEDRPAWSKWSELLMCTSCSIKIPRSARDDDG